MYTYSLVTGSTSVQRSDGAFIPADPNNSDYAAYLEWVAAGNTPTPVPAPSLADAQQSQIALISAACQTAIYAGFSSSALGAAHHYPYQLLDQQNLSSDVTTAMSVVQSAVAWAPNTLYATGALVAENGQIQTNLTTGLSGPNTPAWPSAVGVTVLDGAATWEIWSMPLWSEDSTGNWASLQHTASQIQQVGRDAVAQRTTYQARNTALAAQVTAATTIAAVQAINW